MPSPFISRQDLADYTGRDGLTTDDGALIAIDAACDLVRERSEQIFNQTIGDTVTLDGTGTSCLLLPERPVNNVGTVVVSPWPYLGGTAYTYGTADYRFTRSGRLYAGTAVNPSWAGATYCGAWPRGEQNVTVTYDHGYTDDTFPRSVRMVALQLAARIIVQGVVKQESDGQQNVTYATGALDLTPTEEIVLEKHRQVSST